jgi:hypothetical protein
MARLSDCTIITITAITIIFVIIMVIVIGIGQKLIIAATTIIIVEVIIRFGFQILSLLVQLDQLQKVKSQ